MFPSITCQKITERINNAKEEVVILNPGPNPIIKNEMEGDLQIVDNRYAEKWSSCFDRYDYHES